MAGRLDTTGVPSSYRWVVISLWLFSSSSSFMALGTIGILLPAITADLHLSPAEQGMLSSAAYWANVALGVPLGWWASRYSPKMLTSVTLILATLFLFFQAWAPGFGALLVGRLAFGLATVAQQPARALLIQQWFRPREIIFVNSLSNVLFGLVVGGGLAASPFILSSFGDDWRATLQVFGVLFAVLAVLWTAFGRERATTEYRRAVSRETGVVRGALGHRDLWIVGFGFLGTTLPFGAFLSFYPTLMLEEYQIPLKWSGGILALGVAVGGVGGLGIGYFASTRNKEGVFLQVLGALMAGTYAGMALAGSIPAQLALSFFNGVAWGFFPILITVPFHLPGIRPREVAVAIAFTIMTTSAGTALGPLITGFLHEGMDSLKLALLAVSFGSLTLCVAGAVLHFGHPPESADSREVVPEG
jgi:MFS family permease